jgi:hypothetical protein
VGARIDVVDREAVVRPAGCHGRLSLFAVVAFSREQRVAASAAAAPAGEEHNGVLGRFDLVLEARKSHFKDEK